MIFNDTLTKSYGTFEGVPSNVNLIVSKKRPTEEEYKSGYMDRFFAKKTNENKIYEIDYVNSKNISDALYKIVSIKWKISGPKNNILKNGVLDKAGVIEQNRFEIDRIHKEEGVDLSSALPNLLEYWKGS